MYHNFWENGLFRAATIADEDFYLNCFRGGKRIEESPVGGQPNRQLRFSDAGGGSGLTTAWTSSSTTTGGESGEGREKYQLQNNHTQEKLLPHRDPILRKPQD